MNQNPKMGNNRRMEEAVKRHHVWAVISRRNLGPWPGQVTRDLVLTFLGYFPLPNVFDGLMILSQNTQGWISYIRELLNL